MPMLKTLLSSATLIAAITTQISIVFLTSPANAVDIATLNARLQKALCTEDWEGGVKVVDQMIALTPSINQSQRNKLEMLRRSMQNLSVSRTNVDNWLESYCATPVNSSTVADNNSFSSASNSGSSKICSPKLSGTAAPMCDLAELLLGTQKFQAATVGAMSAKPTVVASFGKRCQGVVPTFLKSPGSVKFLEEPIVDQVATGVYVTYGKVDAQNTYGALLRGSYTCIFRNDSNKGTELVTADVHTPQ